MGFQVLNYLNFSEKLHFREKKTDIEQVSRFFEYLHRFQQHLNFFRDSTFFIIDYTERSHILMTGPVLSISGYMPDDFLKGGLDFVVAIFQKDDFRVWNSQMFPQIFQFLQQQPHEEHLSYIFEFTYRFHKKGGDSYTIWQKCSFLTDPVTGLPLFSFGVASNISAIKRDRSMVKIVTRIDERNERPSYMPISTDYFYPIPEEASLSRREKEILLWLAEGLSSKQLAHKLGLSPNTILNHRKNMLRKTNSKNVAELIRFAIENKII